MPKHTPELTQPQLPFGEVHADFITLAKSSKDITGQRFGRLIALGPVARPRPGNIMWLCRCDCGNTPTINGRDIRSKHTRSCGCLHDETAAASMKTHGLTNDPLHSTWGHIVQRCTNTTSKDYARYGGRGITICDEWRHDFKAFHDYVSQLPHCGKKSYTLDRMNNSLGYSPGNVRWATQHEQQRNRRDTYMLTYNGETKCLTDWAHDTGINRNTLAVRLLLGWSVEKTLTQTVRPMAPRGSGQRLKL